MKIERSTELLIIIYLWWRLEHHVEPRDAITLLLLIEEKNARRWFNRQVVPRDTTNVIVCVWHCWRRWRRHGCCEKRSAPLPLAAAQELQPHLPTAPLIIISVPREAYPGLDSTATNQQLAPHLWWNSRISRMRTYPTKLTPKVQINSANGCHVCMHLNMYVHVVVNGPSNPARTNQSTKCTYYSSKLRVPLIIFFLEKAAIY